ncbi:MAG: hypothetical protein IH589_20820 [Anaerolineales bacterium]|nr:hypothetical protein [Anaerolineales bacterium]
MKVRPVYNLEFPSWCPEINIYGYRFTRVDDYEKRFLSLQHLNSVISEFDEDPNTGTHSITAFVELPDPYEKGAIFDWSGTDHTALIDILLLLSLFTGREVFALEEQNSKKIRNSNDVIIADPRVYQRGGILRCSIPYKKQPIEPEPFSFDIGFEEGINQIYELIRSDEWQKEYRGGYFLILAKTAFRRQTLESSFVQCWTIWEHLFAVLNDRWLSTKQIVTISSVEKISFLLVKFALTGEIDNNSRKKIEALAEIRNRLIHFGRFPERETVYDDAILFIHLTEFIIAKTLNLSPSNVFNTVEKLEKYLEKIQKPSKHT